MKTESFLKLLLTLYADQERLKVKYSVVPKVSNSNKPQAESFKKKHKVL